MLSSLGNFCILAIRDIGNIGFTTFMLLQSFQAFLMIILKRIIPFEKKWYPAPGNGRGTSLTLA